MKKRDASYYGAAKWAEMQREEAANLNDKRLADFKAAGVEWVEWLTAGFEECPHCLAMSGKVVRLADVKFSEHPDCEHEQGCRCVWIAVSGPKKTKP